jgi:hypothetical protein
LILFIVDLEQGMMLITELIRGIITALPAK